MGDRFVKGDRRLQGVTIALTVQDATRASNWRVCCRIPGRREKLGITMSLLATGVARPDACATGFLQVVPGFW